MNIILFTKHSGSSTQFDLARPATLAAAFGGVLVLCAVLFGSGYLIAAKDRTVEPDERVAQLEAVLASRDRQLEDATQTARESLEALAVRIGRVQSHVIRLDALGRRLTRMGGLEDGEFNFDTPPPSGGPELEVFPETQSPEEFLRNLNELTRQLNDREQQLDVLESLLMNRNLEKQVHPAGRPLKAGWISSFYGKRRDPFTGKPTRHEGVDFAGREGAEVIAVGAGVVSWSADRYGYGNMVEVNHGNGYVTRYAHNKANLVAVGDVVEKGQVIALMGSTGRATGPNLHFEVIRDGRTVDPLTFIKAQAAR